MTYFAAIFVCVQSHPFETGTLAFSPFLQLCSWFNTFFLEHKWSESYITFQMKPWNCLITAIQIFHLLHPKIPIASNLGIMMIIHFSGISRHTSLFSFVSNRNYCYSSWRARFCSAIHFHSISITPVLMLIQFCLHGILALHWIDSAFQLCVINIFQKPTPTF